MRGRGEVGSDVDLIYVSHSRSVTTNCDRDCSLDLTSQTALHACLHSRPQSHLVSGHEDQRALTTKPDLCRQSPLVLLPMLHRLRGPGGSGDENDLFTKT